jgi:hypothetical protein
MNGRVKLGGSIDNPFIDKSIDNSAIHTEILRFALAFDVATEDLHFFSSEDMKSFLSGTEKRVIFIPSADSSVREAYGVRQDYSYTNENGNAKIKLTLSPPYQKTKLSNDFIGCKKQNRQGDKNTNIGTNLYLQKIKQFWNYFHSLFLDKKKITTKKPPNDQVKGRGPEEQK